MNIVNCVVLCYESLLKSENVFSGLLRCKHILCIQSRSKLLGHNLPKGGKGVVRTSRGLHKQ